MATSADAQVRSPTEEIRRPAYAPLRYEEDWSVLRDLGDEDALDAIKFIPLGSGVSYLSLGGELRERYTDTRNPLWGSTGQEIDDAFLQRAAFHADLHWGEHLRLFGQLFSALEWGRTGQPSPVDQNTLDVQQAFAEVAADVGAGRLFFRAGRQELIYGSARLIDAREGTNVRRAFTGVRASYHTPSWQWDLLAVRPMLVNPGPFDDEVNHDQALWGLYAVTAPNWIGNDTLDLYYLGYRSDSNLYRQGAAKERRYTLGMRWSGTNGAWDWNWELVGQYGEFGDSNIRSWGLATDTGYTWRDARWSPRLGLSINNASGDHDPNNPALQTFNPLFPRGNYFSELALLGPRNFYNLHPFLTLYPRPDLTFTTDVDFYWRWRRGDGIYAPSGQLLRSGSGASSHFVGTELSTRLTWQVTPRLVLSAVYAHFFSGPFLRETGPALDIDFLETTAKWTF